MATCLKKVYRVTVSSASGTGSWLLSNTGKYEIDKEGDWIMVARTDIPRLLT